MFLVGKRNAGLGRRWNGKARVWPAGFQLNEQGFLRWTAEVALPFKRAVARAPRFLLQEGVSNSFMVRRNSGLEGGWLDVIYKHFKLFLSSSIPK